MSRIKLVGLAALLSVASTSCSEERATTASSSGGSAGSGGESPRAPEATSAGTAGRTDSTLGGTGNSGPGDLEPEAGEAGAAGQGGGVATVVLPTLVTSARDAYWKTDQPWTEVSSGAADVTVDDSAVGQPWIGFGGTFSERGGDALASLSATEREGALSLVFGRDGLRFSYGRIPIGASDYAIDRYSLDETPGDITMADFSIQRDEQKLIPYIKAALAVAPDLHLWASPWSPPTWMKSNQAFDGGSLKEDDETLHALALYLTKFVQEYDKRGIRVEVIHPQKEPNLALDFPSCVWSPLAMSRFIGVHLGPMFAEQNVSSKIFLGSLSEDGGNEKSLAIIDAVTSDAVGMSYIQGFGFEWSGLGLVAKVKPRNMPIWQDNHNVGNLPWGSPFNPTAAPNDHDYAVTSWGFVRDWLRAGVGAYFTSNMILDSVGIGIGDGAWPQNALLVVDAASKKLLVTPAFYVFRHLSAFVEPGASLVGTSGGDALAFKNPDGSIVATLFNAGAAQSTTVAIAGKKLRFDLPESGWATIKAKP